MKMVRWKAILFMKTGKQTESTTHKTGLTFG